MQAYIIPEQGRAAIPVQRARKEKNNSPDQRSHTQLAAPSGPPPPLSCSFLAAVGEDFCPYPARDAPSWFFLQLRPICTDP